MDPSGPHALEPHLDTDLVRAGSTDVTLGSEPSLDPSAPIFADPDEDRASFAPGDLINGRFEIVELLGIGGMGKVYRVRDGLHGGRELALKTIRQAAFNPALLGQLKAEFRTMTRLRHPHVAAAFDFEALKGTDEHFLTMEYVAGKNIHDASRGRSWEQLLDWIVQICRALSYLHSRAVIHFDLKPANVMVDAAGAIKVVDFGVAGRGMAALHRPRLRGTPR